MVVFIKVIDHLRSAVVEIYAGLQSRRGRILPACRSDACVPSFRKPRFCEAVS